MFCVGVTALALYICVYVAFPKKNGLSLHNKYVYLFPSFYIMMLACLLFNLNVHIIYMDIDICVLVCLWVCV